MADLDERTLERQASNPTAGAALLRHRVRVGVLAQDRVELAAYCGHPAATVAASVQVRHPLGGVHLARPFTPPVGFQTWLLELLERWPTDEVAVRAMLPVARDAFYVYYNPGGMRSTPRGYATARSTIEVTQAWLDCPCEEHRVACERATADALLDGLPWAWGPARLAAGFDDGHLLEWYRARTFEAILESVSVLKISHDTLREKISEALIEWALGG